jgi:hypothetical protein
MADLTSEQTAMLTACIRDNSIWMTGREGRNATLLAEWERQGWFEKAPMPEGIPENTFGCWRITPAGLSSLANKTQEPSS